ncbi:fluoride efflux transporter CrcB [Streptomyces sp. NPDC050560]|uniref:fluoride efflux transporter CrcB n=1 Tax=Streptomyces sp. NPDC050560 TaxID=3365630 RepID=UPI0037B1ADCD
MPEHHTAHPEPVDPDIDLHVPAQRAELSRSHGAILAAIAVGGAAGSCARYGASLLWPTSATAFPWTTLGVNALGCLLIGILMVLVTEVWTAHPLVRPLLGTGVLGGFTTFSTYAGDIRRLTDVGHAGRGLVYLALTLVAALLCVWLATTVTRLLVRVAGLGPAAGGAR